MTNRAPHRTAQHGLELYADTKMQCRLNAGFLPRMDSTDVRSFLDLMKNAACLDNAKMAQVVMAGFEFWSVYNIFVLTALPQLLTRADVG